MMKKLSFVAVLFLMACSNDSTTYEELDLLQYGVPLTINAPVDAEINATTLGNYPDVTIKEEASGYNLQIIGFPATSTDAAKVKSEELDSLKTKSYFSKVVADYDHGFIYETDLDTINYDFRLYKIQGNTQYTFQMGFLGIYTQEQVEKVYDSVKEVK